jgi:hypothetical protein
MVASTSSCVGSAASGKGVVVLAHLQNGREKDGDMLAQSIKNSILARLIEQMAEDLGESIVRIDS